MSGWESLFELFVLFSQMYFPWVSDEDGTRMGLWRVRLLYITSLHYV